MESLKEKVSEPPILSINQMTQEEESLNMLFRRWAELDQEAHSLETAETADELDDIYEKLKGLIFHQREQERRYRQK